MLQRISISNFTTIEGAHVEDISLTYEIFGKPLFEAPIVLVNHALTGNSKVCGERGWWNSLIGKEKCIDTDQYTVLAFNIPGNGYGEAKTQVFENYKIFKARDIAHIFLKGLETLNIKKLFAVIGGSLGGGIAWELAALRPDFIEHLIPIACDWKATDWLKANCLIQEQLLLNSKNPVHDARLHAMILYRSPESFSARFKRSYNHEQNMFNIESWLLHHGEKLDARFELSAYKQLNYILANIDITYKRGGFLDVVKNITSNIHLISVNSDIFFTLTEDRITYTTLKEVKQNVTHGIIDSIHGHDAFLIEYEQLNRLLKDVF
ncbi:alpha/beta fold hydrolase [Aquimarina sp. U1-2]|uniref:alpha/beta fold hydrolase n=1 Tax=Aquimarina sp. U1-2 TaxID=2823141 RepID=UPI001FED7022|nr:alpha/beta fold hydrolase [Aquimarina sp. U1-2]